MTPATEPTIAPRATGHQAEQFTGEVVYLLRSEQASRWMLILEFSMAMLFVIDVVLVIIGLKK